MMVERGRQLLDWLIDVQTSPAGHLSPIGNDGWWPRGGRRARFDQQPIEATALLLAARGRPARSTGDERYRGDHGAMLRLVPRAERRRRRASPIPERGAGHDGLTPTGVNRNQGAESTLMWLIALERIRRVRMGRAIGASTRSELVGPGPS